MRDGALDAPTALDLAGCCRSPALHLASQVNADAVLAVVAVTQLKVVIDVRGVMSPCVLSTLVDELCAAAPTVMVIDDLQWADDASLTVWHQLAASIDQLRLVLIGTCRSPSQRQEVQQLRAAVVRRGGAVITLGPLAETDVADLVKAMVGVPPGDTLRRLTAQAGGNPLYVSELTDHITCAGVKQAADQMYQQVAITAEDIAEVIAFAVTRPRRVTLNEILVRPAQP